MSKDTKTVPTALKFAFGGLSGVVSLEFFVWSEQIRAQKIPSDDSLKPADRMWCCLCCATNGSCEK